MVTWADGLAAIGTTLAAVVAVTLAVREAILGRRDRADRYAAAERDQASRVYAWESFHGLGTADDEPELIGMVHEVSVQNASTGPVFDVGVYYGDIAVDSSEATPLHVPALLPGQTRTNSSDFDTSDKERDLRLLRAVDPLLRVTFRDAAGRHWERTSDGSLHRQPARDAV